MVAAVAIVRAVPLALELGRRDRLVRDPDGARDVARAVELARRERGRDGRDGERALAERARGERRDERRVDAARERDDALPSERSVVSSSSIRRHGVLGAGERLGPDRLYGAPGRPGNRGAVVVLGRDVDDAAVEDGRP